MENKVQETLQRLIRMESRLVQLGDHVGANLRTKQRVEIRHKPEGGVCYVEIDSLDVSVSRVLSELQRAGIKQRRVGVFHGEHIAFILYCNY